MSKYLLVDVLKRPTEEWTAERLEQLTITELKTVCRLVGIGYSYTHKSLFVESLLRKTAIQRLIRPYWGRLEDRPTAEQIQCLANALKHKELKQLCRHAGIYAPGTKYGMAASLIAWDRQCMGLGRAYFERHRAIAMSQPKQLKLF
jgi:hypothetical protein